MLREADVTSLLQVLITTDDSFQNVVWHALRIKYFPQTSPLTSPQTSPHFFHCHTESYNKWQKWALTDGSQEHSHTLPGGFLGRLHSEAVTLPIISATACNRKIHFP